MGFEITTPGSLSTVQDLGRFGYQRYGFSPSGAADTDALKLLNAILGNDLGEAAVEMTALGLTGEFDTDCVFAITGADNKPKLNDSPIEINRAIKAKKGDILSCGCGFEGKGFRTYFGVSGGFDIQKKMGSRSTGIKFSVGGFEGRKLSAGDNLKFRENVSDLRNMDKRAIPVEERSDKAVLRVIPGPQNSRFTEEAFGIFTSSEYTVTGQLDRMGIRLEGESVPAISGYDIISDATATGSIQITNNGKPIILLADRQTTGGYTKIATVITADLPLAGQLYPGCTVRFESISVEEAQKEIKKKVKYYEKLAKKLRR